jgi:hypothetical protein
MTEYKRICLMMPTFKRISKLKTCIDSALDTCSNKESIVFSFCLNVNDTISREFVSSYSRITGMYEVIDEDTMQPNLSLYWNLMYDTTKYRDAIVTEIGDDMIFKTSGWDEKILKAINESDGLAIVHCDDDFIAHEKCCVNLFVTRKLVDASKKPFMCEFFHADMIDSVWTMVGLMTGLKKYLSDVVIYHDHVTRQKSAVDLTCSRLQPVQREANQHKAYAVAYATVVARNLIENGIGQWNTLQ